MKRQIVIGTDPVTKDAIIDYHDCGDSRAVPGHGRTMESIFLMSSGSGHHNVTAGGGGRQSSELPDT